MLTAIEPAAVDSLLRALMCACSTIASSTCSEGRLLLTALYTNISPHAAPNLQARGRRCLMSYCHNRGVRQELSPDVLDNYAALAGVGRNSCSFSTKGAYKVQDAVLGCVVSPALRAEETGQGSSYGLCMRVDSPSSGYV